MKTRRKKTARPNRGKQAIAGRRVRGSSAANLKAQLDQRTRERDEARAQNERLLEEAQARARDLSEAQEQQTATAEVLRVISSSPSDLEPVFRMMLANTVRLCEAKFGNLFLCDGDAFRIVAMHNAPPAYAKERRRVPLSRPAPTTVFGRALRTKRPVQIADIRDEPDGSDSGIISTGAKLAKLAGARTTLAVPMVKEQELVGAILIYRQEVRPFTAKQIELVNNFANQAVIAIENARLLNELRESLDRQTATADILRVIAGTPEDSKRALDTIAETASRMFDSANVIFRRLEGNVLRVVSAAGPSFAKLREVVPDAPLEPPTEPGVRCFLENKQIAIEDRLATPPNEHGEIDRALQDLARRGLPIRSQAFTPLLREGKAIGVMIVSRGEVRSFQDHELELMRGFADQAVIAIENARLLSELRGSLEQQTATADVLRVISASPGELKPVFDTILENATRICEAKFGVLCSYNGDLFKYVAVWNAPPAFLEFMRQRGSFAPRAGTPLDRILKTKNIIHRADASVEEVLTDTARLAGAKSHLTVPMFKDEALVGAIIIYRQEVRPFNEKQIALVQNFAAQAVIAIENTRLLNELRQRTTDLTESLEQQTAASEVLSIISSSPAELEPVFQAILANATRLC